MRLFLSGFLLSLLICCGHPVQAQGNSAATVAAQDQFFSGTITALGDGKITVSRSVLGKESATRTFLITPQTKIEGKPRVKARVTVRFVPGEEGDKAVHIIVRASTPKK